MNIAKTYFFSSDSDPDKTYQTQLYADGTTSCDCRGWTFKRGTGPRSCKHTRFVEAGMGERYAVKVLDGDKVWPKSEPAIKVTGAGLATVAKRKFNWEEGT
jgi:hypothetical protein